MLPFMKSKQNQTGVIVKQRAPDEQAEPKSELHEIAEDMIKAINSNDSKMLAELFKEAFQHCELQPHEEAEHYDELNERAAQEQE